MSDTLQQKRKKRAELIRDGNKISQEAKKDDRQITEEELGQIDAKLNEAEALEVEIQLEEKKLKNTERLEQAMQGLQEPGGRLSEDGPELVNITPEGVKQFETQAMPGMPAVIKRYGPLRAFRGPHAKQHAYAVGHWFIAKFLNPEKYPQARTSREWIENYGPQYGCVLETGVLESGGAITPSLLSNAVIDLKEEYGVLRQLARIRPMSSDKMSIPRRTSGLTVYYPGQTGSITESDKQWDVVELVLNDWATLTRVSAALNEDAIVNLADDLAREIAYAFAVAEDTNGINGDGTTTFGRIEGITTLLEANSSLVSHYAATSGDDQFSEIILSDLEAVMGTLPMFAEMNAGWIISPFGFANCFVRLAAAGGGNTIETIMTGEGMIRTRRVFLGYPVSRTPVLPNVGTAQNGNVMLLFGDPMLACSIGQRSADIGIELSEHRYFEYNQIGVRGMQRIDINWHDYGDTSVAGPIVGLVGTT